MKYDVSFQNDGRLRLLIVVGTRPEIIRLAAVIKKCRDHFDTILCHTGQNYDYTLNGIFFADLGLAPPDVSLDAVGGDLGETMGNIIARSYALMAQIRPDAVLVLGDTNSCLSVIGAKRLHIPIFHMEAGNRCKDECLPEETNRRIVDVVSDVNLAYSERARDWLLASGLPAERVFVTGSPMAEVLHEQLPKIEASDIHARLGLQKGKYILLSAHREENIDTDRNFNALFGAVNRLAESYDMPVLYSCHPRSAKKLDERYGLVGEITMVNPGLVENAIQNGYIPVISTVVDEEEDIQMRLDAGVSILNVVAGKRTPEVVRTIREKYPEVPIMASGGKSEESILRTIESGADTICYTSPSNAEIFSSLMETYRVDKTKNPDGILEFIKNLKKNLSTRE